jgi:transposase-like protein
MPEAFAQMPPFCPEPHCISHRSPLGWSFKKKGFFTRQHAPYTVQRYVCKQCGRNFSTQTFSVTYWLREPELLGTLFWRVLACSAYRQIAHELKVSHTTVQRQVERLGRHCLLCMKPGPARREALVLDGLQLRGDPVLALDLNVLGKVPLHLRLQRRELRRSG